jgi:hypothetical protein
VTHVLDAVAPRADEDVPALHSVHPVAACALQEPAPHCMIEVDPSPPSIFAVDAAMHAVSPASQAGLQGCPLLTVTLPAGDGVHDVDPGDEE